eukprot:m.874613 g.874613  ORF g.874613 m.874613 type:complete len:60 (-) comp23576_c0_seq14:1703-1882(-)
MKFSGSITSTYGTQENVLLSVLQLDTEWKKWNFLLDHFAQQVFAGIDAKEHGRLLLAFN